MALGVPRVRGHGDIFPLPVPPELPAVDARARGRHYLAQRWCRSHARRGRLRDSVLALNWCYSAAASGPGRFDPSEPSSSARATRPSPLQEAVLERMGRLVDSFGDGGPPVPLDEAAAELLRVPDMYSEPRDILEVAALEVKKMFMNVVQFRRSEEELERARMIALLGPDPQEQQGRPRRPCASARLQGIGVLQEVHPQ